MGKRVLVLGATGPLGIHICEEGLKHGYNLTVYARNPDKLPKDIVEHTNVKVCLTPPKYKRLRLQIF